MNAHQRRIRRRKVRAQQAEYIAYVRRNVEGLRMTGSPGLAQLVSSILGLEEEGLHKHRVQKDELK